MGTGKGRTSQAAGAFAQLAIPPPAAGAAPSALLTGTPLNLLETKHGRERDNPIPYPTQVPADPGGEASCCVSCVAQ